MNVLCAQLDIEWENRPANLRRAAELVESARPQAGDLIVLPEMFATGFSMNVAASAEPDDRPGERMLSELSRRWGAYVVGGVVNRGAGGAGRNEAVLTGPDGRELARYCKMHPFSYAGEHRHYQAGERLAIVDVAGIRVCPVICYDLRFPELFRSAVRQGAEAFVVIANWPAARADHWRVLLAARAIENQAFVVGVNRCGADPSNTYAGGSAIIDPRGAVLALAGEAQQVVSAELDVESLRAYRREFPVLRDMRSEFRMTKPPR